MSERTTHWRSMDIGGRVPPLLDLPTGRLQNEIVGITNHAVRVTSCISQSG